MDMAQENKGGIVSAVDKLSGNNDYAGELHSSPYDVQVLVEGTKAGDPIPLAPGAMAAGEGGRCGGSGGNLSSVVLGIVAASTAVTALSGGALSPAVAFGSFLVLLGGVALAMASVRTTT